MVPNQDTKMVEMMDFMKKYGYLEDSNEENSELIVESKSNEMDLIDGIKMVQRVGGLKETGILDDQTFELIKKPRCGFNDKQLIRKLEKSNSKRQKRYSINWKRYKWNKQNLTWSLEKGTEKIEMNLLMAELNKGLQLWTNASNINFEYTDESIKPVDIVVSFKGVRHFDDDENAHAYFPLKDEYGGDVHLNNDVNWGIHSEAVKNSTGLRTISDGSRTPMSTQKTLSCCDTSRTTTETSKTESGTSTTESSKTESTTAGSSFIEASSTPGTPITFNPTERLLKIETTEDTFSYILLTTTTVGKDMKTDFMKKYGYLEDSNEENSELIVESKSNEMDLIDGIKMVQRVGGLKETGILDDQTFELIKKPRCGFNDKQLIRKLEKSTTTNKRQKRNLFDGPIDDIEIDLLMAEFNKGFKLWTDASNINFEFSHESNESVDISVAFKESSHFDNVRDLAHAYYPNDDEINKGDIHLNKGFNWGIHSEAIHDAKFILTEDDIKRIRTLYPEFQNRTSVGTRTPMSTKTTRTCCNASRTTTGTSTTKETTTPGTSTTKSITTGTSTTTETTRAGTSTTKQTLLKSGTIEDRTPTMNSSVEEDIKTVMSENDFMKKYGYLEDSNEENSELIVESKSNEMDLIDGIKMVQRVGGLKETGILDDQTFELIKKPRCGFNDKQLIRKLEKSNSKRQKRYTFNDKRYKWNKQNLTWRFDGPIDDVEINLLMAELNKGFKLWTKASNINFEYNRKSDKSVDISVGFKENSHFGLFSTTLAHAYYPNEKENSGDIHFNKAYNWGIHSEAVKSNWFSKTRSILAVFTHEIGHSLGLAHSLLKTSVMYAYDDDTYDAKFILTEDDIKGIRELYPEFQTKTDVSTGTG
ncbi:hypothetical protein CHUAL_011340 [Chamberlinius hualienensis]